MKVSQQVAVGRLHGTQLTTNLLLVVCQTFPTTLISRTMTDGTATTTATSSLRMHISKEHFAICLEANITPAQETTQFSSMREVRPARRAGGSGNTTDDFQHAASDLRGS